jgi:hypothetical protein
MPTCAYATKTKAFPRLSTGRSHQLLTYLKLKGLKLGFVLNFGTNLMKDRIERIVNGLDKENLRVFASLCVRNAFSADHAVQARGLRRMADLCVMPDLCLA